MIRFLTALAIATPAVAQAQQVLVGDDAHLQREAQNQTAPAIYVIKAEATVLLDASKYEFKVPPQIAGKPINSIQVVAGKDRQFAAVWSPTISKLLLSASTLQPNPGSAPFPGFVPGQTVILAIGNLEDKKFSVVWVGMAKVQ